MAEAAEQPLEPAGPAGARRRPLRGEVVVGIRRHGWM
jgi:hypothetical protein